MKTKINGIETNNGLTVREFAEAMKKKTGFNEFANGFKTSITKEEEVKTATDLLNELGLNPFSPSYFKNTRAISERSYYNYYFRRGLK